MTNNNITPDPVTMDGLVERMVEIANRDDTTGLAADALREGSEALADRDATIERMREALREIASSARGGGPFARDRDEDTLAAISRHADFALAKSAPEEQL